MCFCRIRADSWPHAALGNEPPAWQFLVFVCLAVAGRFQSVRMQKPGKPGVRLRDFMLCSARDMLFDCHLKKRVRVRFPNKGQCGLNSHKINVD